MRPLAGWRFCRASPYRADFRYGTAAGTTRRIPLPTGGAAGGLRRFNPVPTSADKVRMGRITGIGKNTLRAILVEASLQLITKDRVIREKYDRIKIRSGGKRAIVAIARTLLLRMRRMLLDERVYALPLAA